MDMKHPRTVKEAVLRLKNGMFEKDLERIKNMKKDKLITIHYGLGKYIRNCFGLWGENQKLIDSSGKKHPDDASFVIIEKLWESLQND